MGDEQRSTRRQFLVGGSVAAGILTLGALGAWNIASRVNNEQQPADLLHPDALSYSADLRYVALSYYIQHTFNLVGMQFQTRILTWPEQKLLQALPLPAGAFDLSAYWSPDDTRLAIATNSAPQVLQIWDVQSGSQTASLGAETDLFLEAAAWSPDGHRLLVGGNQRFVVLDTSTGTRLFETEVQVDLSGGAPGITAFTWSPDGQAFAFLTPSTTHATPSVPHVVTNWTVEIWDSRTYQRTNRLVPLLPSSLGFIRSPQLAWSPRGDRLGLSLNTALWILNPADSARQSVPPVLVDPPNAVSGTLMAWSPDGTRLARVYLDLLHPLSVWEVDDHHPLPATFLGPPHTDAGSFDALAWSADGKQIRAVAYPNTESTWTVS